MRLLLNKVLSIIIFVILYIYTAVLVLLFLVLALLNLKKPIHILSKIWAKSVLFLIGKKIRFTGIQNINKRSKYLLLANHSSLFDIVAIMAFYPGISWFGHERLLRVPLFGRLLKMNGYVPFREPTYKNTRDMIEQLVLRAKNQTVAIFPEGTRTLDGRINEFYRGFIYLLRNTDLDILPVTLNGFYDLKPKNRSYINFSARLEIIIHEPIKREELIVKSDIEIIDTVRAVIESAYRNDVISSSFRSKRAS